MAIDIDITTTFLGDTDAPDTYVGQASKVVSVKTDETGLEFTTPAAGGDTNIMNANLTLDIDRTQNLNSKSLYFNNGKQFKWLNNVAPTIGEGSFQLQGYGSTGSDVVYNLKNGASQDIVNIYGDKRADWLGNIIVRGIAYCETIKNPYFSTVGIGIGSAIDYNGRGEIGISYANHRFDTDSLLTTAGSKIVTFANAGNIKFSIDKDGKINTVGMPTSSAGLSSGDLWSDSGTIKII